MTTPYSTDTRVLAKRSANAIDRIGELENAYTLMSKDMQRVLPAIDQAIQAIQQQLSGAIEVLDAVVATLGVETIEKCMIENRRSKATTMMETDKARLEAELAAGSKVAVPAITDKSTVVGTEKEQDGSVRHPGRAQLVFSRIAPDFQDKLLGQAVGFVLELPTGGNFTVDGIYEDVEKPEVSGDFTNAGPVGPVDGPALEAPAAEVK